MTEKELYNQLEEYDKTVIKLSKENKKLKSRINKAIDYMNKRTFEEEVMFEYEVRELYKILKGEENDS